MPKKKKVVVVAAVLKRHGQKKKRKSQNVCADCVRTSASALESLCACASVGGRASGRTRTQPIASPDLATRPGAALADRLGVAR